MTFVREMTFQRVVACTLSRALNFFWSRPLTHSPAALGCRGYSRMRGLLPNERSQLLLVCRTQGYLAHKKLQPPLGPLYDPRHSPTVGS